MTPSDLTDYRVYVTVSIAGDWRTAVRVTDRLRIGPFDLRRPPDTACQALQELLLGLASGCLDKEDQPNG